MNHKLESKVPGETTTSDMQMIPLLWQKAKGSLLMKVKEEREKAGIKPNIQKMASGPITSWQIDGGKMETVTDFFLGLQNHMDSDCNHEIKRCLLLERKTMTKLDSILKGRDITLPTNVCIVKAMVFPVVIQM